MLYYVDSHTHDGRSESNQEPSGDKCRQVSGKCLHAAVRKDPGRQRAWTYLDDGACEGDDRSSEYAYPAPESVRDEWGGEGRSQGPAQHPISQTRAGTCGDKDIPNRLDGVEEAELFRCWIT